MTIRVVVADDQAMVRQGFSRAARRPGRASRSSARPRTAQRGRPRGPDPRGRRRPDGHPDAGDGRHRGDPRRSPGCPATASPGCWCSPRSTSTTTSTRRCARAPAASCSRTPRPTTWSHAVRVVAAGEALLAPAVTRRLIEEFASRPTRSTPHPGALASLTPREREVLELVAPRAVERRDRRAAGAGRADRQDARRPHPHQARPARPGAGGRARLRDRAGPPGR